MPMPVPGFLARAVPTLEVGALPLRLSLNHERRTDSCVEILQRFVHGILTPAQELGLVVSLPRKKETGRKVRLEAEAAAEEAEARARAKRARLEQEKEKEREKEELQAGRGPDWDLRARLTVREREARRGLSICEPGLGIRLDLSSPAHNPTSVGSWGEITALGAV
jgi:hypothetical protein